MSTCRSCGAAIEWARAASTGRRIPLDVAPAPNGNLVLLHGQVSPYGAIDERDGRARRISHFATCPDAADWRTR